SSASGSPGHGGWTQLTEAPENPGRFNLCYYPRGGARYNITKLKGYLLYYLTHHFERLFYSAQISSKTISIIKNVLFLPIKFIDAQVKGQIVVISHAPINRSLVINSVEAFIPYVKEAARNDFETAILSAATTDSKANPKAEIDKQEYLFRYLRKILTYRHLAMFSCVDHRWILRRLTIKNNTDKYGKQKHELIGNVSVTSEEQENYSDFVEWFRQMVSGSDGNNGFRKTFPLGKKIKPLSDIFHDVRMKSGHISIVKTPWSDIGVVLFFEETEDILRLSEEEIYMLITRALNNVVLVKERHLADREKIYIAHDSPDAFAKMMSEFSKLNERLSSVDKILAEVRERLSSIGGKNQIIAEVRERLSSIDERLADWILPAWNMADDYYVQANSTLRKTFIEYEQNEDVEYSLRNEIDSLINYESYNGALFTAVCDKLRDRYKTGKYGNILKHLLSNNYPIIQKRLAEIFVSTNKRALRFFLSGLIKNALDHTDWSAFEKIQNQQPIIIIEAKEEGDIIILKVANIPRPDNALSLNDRSVFCSQESSHLRRIGDTFTAATGSENICFNNFDGNFICVEMRYRNSRKKDES
ncbi:MAG: hypothetical protein ACYDEX_25275, partial [Mobilitalea sp.]